MVTPTIIGLPQRIAAARLVKWSLVASIADCHEPGGYRRGPRTV